MSTSWEKTIICYVKGTQIQTLVQLPQEALEVFCGVFWIQVMWPDATAIKFRPQDLGSEPCWISVIADRNTDAKAVTSTCLIHPPLGLFPHLSISNLKSCGCKEIIQTKNTQVEKSQLMLEKKKRKHCNIWPNSHQVCNLMQSRLHHVHGVKYSPGASNTCHWQLYT